MSFNPSEPRLPKGSAGGGRWGGGGSGGSGGSKSDAPRDAAAAKAQQDPKVRTLFDKLMGLSPDERAKYVRGLSDADLELLTEGVYSARTSDPDIVRSRVAVANEMTKRGIDIKKYGALGGGLSSKSAPVAARKVTPAQRAAVAHVQARKAASAPAKHASTPPKPAPPGRRAI